MILSRDVNPKNHLYTTGSLIISALNKCTQENIDSGYLYNEIRKDYDMSITVYSLGLDWLYIIGAVELDNGKLLKCF